MARLNTCKESALSNTSLEALEPVRINGRLSEIYLQFANSEPALQAYLTMEAALKAGSLSEREIECIKLLVSELTNCEFCLSIHTVKSRAAGLDLTEQRAIRRGDTLEDERSQVLCELIRTLYGQRGVLAPDFLDRVRAAGFSDENLVDICMAYSTIVFTNMTNHINHSKSPLPPAPSLD